VYTVVHKNVTVRLWSYL